MEKLKLRNWMLVGMISFGMVGSGFSMDLPFFKKEKEVESLKGNRLQNRKEYKDMQVTMTRIQKDKERIAYHKKQLKLNKEANKTIPAHMSKKEVRKAKADLRRDKKYLRIDRRDLKADQKVAIRQAKKQERECAQGLREAKRQLRKDLRQNNTEKLQADAYKVDYYLWKKEQMGQSTASLETDVDEFFAFLDEEIDEVV
ncbi:MAG: hypothetical protein N4A41_05125 [Crocinitomicaceae bacterium]|jgi:hypothetical protein|nr:hypothetical protein [Crocinitomicaceae bacterium]